MKPLEERLRDAMNAAGDLVPEREPRSLPAAGQRRRRRLRTPLRFPPWGMQLRVAAAVMAVLVIFVAISVAFDEPQPPDREPGMPRFFVASYLSDEGDASRLEVRETTSGRLLDTRNAPAGVTFRDVAAAGEGVYYAVSQKISEKPCETIIYRVKVNGSGTITGLEPIPGRPAPGLTSASGSLAATSDGQRLAYVTDRCSPDSPDQNRSTLTILDPAAGRQQRWRAPAGFVLSWLSWSADGRYLFFSLLGADSESEELRRLDTSRPVKDLVRDSSRIRALRTPYRLESVVAGTDGRHAYLTEGEVKLQEMETDGSGAKEKGTKQSPESTGPSEIKLLQISAETGQTERVIQRPAESVTGTEVLEIDASGRYLFTTFGILDLRGSGPLLGVPNVELVFDVAW